MKDSVYTDNVIRILWVFTAIFAIAISFGTGNWEQGIVSLTIGAIVALVPAALAVWCIAFPIAIPLAMLIAHYLPIPCTKVQ